MTQRALIPDWISTAYEGETVPERNGNVAGEALRQLNHTLGQVRHAPTVMSLVNDLAYCLERMPQAAEHLREWLRRHEEQGLLDRDGGKDASEDIAIVRATLADGITAITMASAHFRAAHNSAARIRGPLTPDERAELDGTGE